MEHRTLGASGLAASRLAYGCSGIWGMRYFSEKKAVALAARACELGVTLFDTGAFYCGGEAERRLGAALKQIGEADILISTKTGTRRDVRGRLYKDFSAGGIRRDVETSLKRLARDALDILHLHGPNKQQFVSSVDTLVRLKEEGKIRAIGLCSDGPTLAETAAQRPLDVVMTRYNVLSRAHGPILKQAKAQGMGVLAIAPLAQGLYRNRFFAPRSTSDFWYLARAMARNRRELARARAADALHQIEGWSAPQAALAFTLRNPDIDSAVMATTRAEHLASNIQVVGRPLPEDAAEKLALLDGAEPPSYLPNEA